MNDNFQKEFRILLPCLFNVFSGGGGGTKRPGIETTVDVRTACQPPTTVRTETIRLHQIRTDYRGCQRDEEKMLVEATMDNARHHNDELDD